MSKYFDEIDPVKFEGRDSENPLAFKYYDSSKILMGKSHGGTFKVCCLLLA